MSKIDELPLDMFGEEEAEPVAVTGAIEPAQEAETAAFSWAPPEPARATRLYDVIAVVAMTVALGLALRVVGAGFTTPVFNAVMAVVIYARVNTYRRAWYYERAVAMQERVEADLAAVEATPMPEQVATYRILFDIGSIAVAAIAVRIMVWMAGFDRVIPDQLIWTVSVVAAIAAYLGVTSKVKRSALHTWMYQRYMHLRESHRGQAG